MSFHDEWVTQSVLKALKQIPDDDREEFTAYYLKGIDARIHHSYLTWGINKLAKEKARSKV